MKVILTILLVFVTFGLSQAQIVRGMVTDQQGQPIPGVNVFIKSTSQGVATDSNGRYQLKVAAGQVVLVFRIIGFEPVERPLTLKNSSVLIIDMALKDIATSLQEVQVVSDTRDFARELMQKVRDNRRLYAESLRQYRCDIYRRVSMQGMQPKRVYDSIEKARTDSLIAKLNPEDAAAAKRKLHRAQKRAKRQAGRHNAKSDTSSVSVDTAMVRYMTGLSEALSAVYHKDPRRYKEFTEAQNDYQVKWPEHIYSFGIGNDAEGMVIDNMSPGFFNYSLTPNDPSSIDINFYRANISLPEVCEQPLQSPLAPTSAVNYSFRYDGVVYEGKRSLYKILVKPVFSTDAMFSGYIIVEDSSWALRYVDLSINPKVLLYDKEFRIMQGYKMVSPGVCVPDSCTIIAVQKDGKRTFTKKTDIRFLDWKTEMPIPEKTFGNEVKKYLPGAFEHDSLWWVQKRPYPLNDEELRFGKRMDSLSKYFNSEEFLFRMDSTYNRIDIWSVVYKGIHYRNREKRYQMYFGPLITQINPFGIGGYRHNLNGTFLKRFTNEFLLETEGTVDYGSRNGDLRFRGGVGLTYVPQRFVRTFIRYGDYYNMINGRSSITNMFSRSNYARTKSFSISQRMEVFNGLFAELSFSYSDQNPITGMHIDNWSNQLFGEANTPVEFERYIKSELQLNLIYRIKQKFVMKGKRKILLGSKWPDITFNWRHGIQGLFDSEVNFDYLEAGIKGYTKWSRWGTSNWAFLAGSFVNSKNLRLLEHKYFRGSDPLFFSNPLLSFQLLGPTLSCSTSFLRATYIHHFDGALLNKVPVINYLRLSPAIGAGYLMMQENNFRHLEVFAGIERVIRIRKELFRLGVYAVTADNNLSKASFTWKIGVSTSNVFQRKWDY